MSVLPAEGASFAAEAPVVIIGAGAAGLDARRLPPATPASMRW